MKSFRNSFLASSDPVNCLRFDMFWALRNFMHDNCQKCQKLKKIRSYFKSSTPQLNEDSVSWTFLPALLNSFWLKFHLSILLTQFFSILIFLMVFSSGRRQTSERAWSSDRSPEGAAETSRKKEFRAEFAQQLQIGARCCGRRAFGYFVPKIKRGGRQVSVFGLMSRVRLNQNTNGTWFFR